MKRTALASARWKGERKLEETASQGDLKNSRVAEAGEYRPGATGTTAPSVSNGKTSAEITSMAP
jgi:hypothetical protein